MPICIECSYPVSHLYSTYSRADDRSLGKGVRLTQCPRCKRFADKYVEYDFVVMFIDLVLIKPQVYRHLLFNRLGRDDDRFDPSIIRVGILLLLFDVYLTWTRIEKSPLIATTFLTRTPIIVQYLFFLSLNALSTFAHHITVRLLASILVPRPRVPYACSNVAGNGGEKSKSWSSYGAKEQSIASGLISPSGTSSALSSVNSQTPQQQSWAPLSPGISSNTSIHETNDLGGNSTGPEMTAEVGSGADLSSVFPARNASTTASVQTIHPLPPPTPASPTAISTALLVSSFPKLFPILLVIWGPDGANNIPEGRSHETSSTTTPSALMQNAIHSVTPSDASVVTSMSLWSSPSSALFSQDWISDLTSSVASSAPTSFLGSVMGLLVSLLSLGAADTHLVLMNNIEALYILLGCGYLRAVMLAAAGQVAPWVVQRLVLRAVGFG